MFTQRAVLLGVVAMCFYLVAVVNSLPGFYYVLVWLAVGLLVSSFGIALLSLAGTQCMVRTSRPFGYANLPGEEQSDDASGTAPESEAALNDAPPLWEVELGNVGTLNKTGLLLELRLSPREKKTAGRKTPTILGRFLIEALPSGAQIKAPLSLGFLERGRYALESTRLTGSDVLGLFRITQRLSLQEESLEVVVGPAVVSPALRREVRRGAGGQEGARARAQLGAGGDLRGVRPYVTGDDWRHVHWATTARTGTLAVREFEHTGRSTVLVVWDGAPGSTWGEGSQSTLEEGLSLCASILLSVDATQTPLALATLGETSTWAQGQSENGLLPRAMVEALADARPQRVGALTPALFRVAEAKNKFGHVFFVSSSLRGDLVEAVRECGARGETVSVALFDGSAWTNREGRRFASGKTAPTQRDGERLVPVSSESYDGAQRALEAAGAHVVRVAPREGQIRRVMLEEALLSLVE